MEKYLNLVRDGHAEPNKCIHYSDGICFKLMQSCPATIRYDDNNNNTPCDLAGYEIYVKKEK